MTRRGVEESLDGVNLFRGFDFDSVVGDAYSGEVICETALDFVLLLSCWVSFLTELVPAVVASDGLSNDEEFFMPRRSSRSPISIVAVSSDEDPAGDDVWLLRIESIFFDSDS